MSPPPPSAISADSTELISHLARPLPEVHAVGRGNVFYLTGRCCHRTLALRSLRVFVDGATRGVGDLERRTAGSRVAWSPRWIDSFDDRWLAELGRLLADE